MQLRFTTYVVTDMKSPHLLSSVHDLAIVQICSDAPQKDSVTTLLTHKMTGRVNSGAQTVSLPILGRVFNTDRMYRAAVQSIVAVLASAISSSATWFSPEPGPVERSILPWTPLCSLHGLLLSTSSRLIWVHDWSF